MMDKNNQEQCLISIILRIAIASLFAAAVYGKFAVGLGNYAANMMSMFKDSILPSWLLVPYINILPFAEILIVLWLLVGIKLRWAWTFTAFVLLTLGFGMIANRQGVTASENYIYMMMACLGIYLSKYDKCSILNCGCKK